MPILARTSRCVAHTIALMAVLSPCARAQSHVALTLDSVLSASVRQNPLLDAARARVAAARGVRSTARAIANPEFTYWTESLPFPFQSTQPGLQRETQTYASIPLEFLYQRRSGVRAADAGLSAATADLARAQQMVALDAARAFYRVAEAQVVLDATNDVRAGLGDLVRYTTARVREGKTAEADQIRTEVELNRVDAGVALSEVELTRARASLAPFLGMHTRDTDSIRVTIDDEPEGSAAAGRVTSFPSLDSLQALARAARPDIIAARARLAAATAEADNQRALTVRHLSATFGSKRTAGVTSMIAGFMVPVPLFDRNRGAIQQTSAMQTAAAAELAWAERQLAADVTAAYASVRTLALQVGRLRGTMLSRAEESRRIAVAAYQEGATGVLQVLDASRTLADARQSWYHLLFAERESRLALRAAIGDASLGAAPPLRDSRTPDDAASAAALLPRATGLTGERR
jgi:outer membrane protein, heavy metal efflux system